MSTLDDQINATREKIVDLEHQLIAYRRILEILQELKDERQVPEKKHEWVYQREGKGMDWQDYTDSARWNFHSFTPAFCPNCNRALVAGEIHVCV